MRRDLPIASLAALALAAALMVPGAFASSLGQAGQILTVLPTSILHLSGTQIYCSVNKGSSVACFHMTSALKRSGYAIVATEKFVAVEPPGTTTPNLLKVMPSLAGIPTFTGGTSYSLIPIEMRRGDVADVGKTRMVIVATAAKGGGSTIGVVYFDGNHNPVVGSYSIGISDHAVTVLQVLAGQKTKLIYRHAPK